MTGVPGRHRVRSVAILVGTGLTAGLAVGCGPKPIYRVEPLEGPSVEAAPAPAPVSAVIPERGRIEAVAASWLGIPYRYGGVDRQGIDCSALVQCILGDLGESVPRTVRDLTRIGTEIPRSDLGGGDLVFFRLAAGRIDHVGIALDADRFVHASSSRGVVIDRIADRWFARRLTSVRRVIAEEKRGETR